MAWRGGWEDAGSGGVGFGTVARSARSAVMASSVSGRRRGSGRETPSCGHVRGERWCRFRHGREKREERGDGEHQCRHQGSIGF